MTKYKAVQLIKCCPCDRTPLVKISKKSSHTFSRNPALKIRFLDLLFNGLTDFKNLFTIV